MRRRLDAVDHGRGGSRGLPDHRSSGVAAVTVLADLRADPRRPRALTSRALPGGASGGCDGTWSCSGRARSAMTEPAVALRDGPLTGIRVVDLTVAIQGPHAAAFLADMGAEVVKVERTAGELNR